MGGLTVEANVVIGKDDGSVALGDTSHCHMENTMRSLDVMLLQTQRGAFRTIYETICCPNRAKGGGFGLLKTHEGHLLID